MLNQVRFRVVLPIVMSTFSATLMLFPRYQHWTMPRKEMGYVEPAGTINAIVNGPGLFIWPWLHLLPDRFSEVFSYTEGRLIGVAAWWFLFGLTIDRRRQGKDFASAYPKVATPLFGILAALSWWASSTGFLYFLEHGGVSALSLRNVGLYSARWTMVALTLWTLLLGLYFVKRCLFAGRKWRESVPKEWAE
jgi:hypothetical protein